MVSPILPLFGRTFGVSTTMIGFLITSFGLARMMLDLPAGVLAHRFGRRPVLVAGSALLSLGSFLCATSSTYSELLLWRFLQGAGSAFYTTAAMTVAADLSRPQNRGRIMAFYHLPGEHPSRRGNGTVARWIGDGAIRQPQSTLLSLRRSWFWQRFGCGEPAPRPRRRDSPQTSPRG